MVAFEMVDGSPRRSNRTVADMVAAAFARHSVKVAFGQSIPSAFHLVAPEYGIAQAGYRTENAGGAMADGYARVSHTVAVVTAQNGPAATLLVPPLAEALKASIPIVALVQEVPAANADRNAFQEIHHFKLFEAVAKSVKRIELPDRVDDYVDMAFTLAASGRPGPVVLLVPADVLDLPARPLPANARSARLGSYPLDRTRPADEALDRAAKLLMTARAPLIVAGGGVHLSDASDELATIQERFHIPVATTVMGKGAVSELHPLSLGVIGYFMADGSRTRDLVEMVKGADVILFVGARTNQNGTDSWTLFSPDTTFIHADIDGIEVGRNYEAAVRLVGDAKLTLTALATALDRVGAGTRKAARPAVEAQISSAIGTWRSQTEKFTSRSVTPLRPEQLMLELDTLLEPDDIVTADASYSSIWVANYLTARKAGQRFITPRGLAGLGWGLPLAIGAQFARPDARVFSLVGDGGFGHVWSEMEMLVRHRLPVVVIVLNNQILGYQKHGETVGFGRYTDAVEFKPVDHAAIARACGVEAKRVERPEDFLPSLNAAAEARRPFVLDVITEERAHPPITSFGKKLGGIFAE